MDHFSEEDARRIFAEAAHTAAPETPDRGLSLAELQEIGRAAGLDPAAIAAAAAGLRDAAPDLPMWGTTPLATRRTRIVPGTLSVDAWAEAVAGLRRTFDTQGVTETIGRQRTWTHTAGDSTQALRVRVTAEAIEGGTRLTAESGDSGQKLAGLTLLSVFGAFGLLMTLFGVVAGVGPAIAFGAVFLMGALAAFASVRWSAARRARTQPAQFDAVLDRIATLASPASAGPDETCGTIETHDAPLHNAPLRDTFDAVAGEDAAPGSADDARRRTQA